MSKKILVTGVRGFAGQYVASSLARVGHEVVGLVNHSPDSFVPGVSEIFACDLRDREKLELILAEVQPQQVMHLAAISFVGHGNVSEIYDVNVVGTRNLLNALSESELAPEAVLLTSSANVYGNSITGILSEDEPFNPTNDYAVSKVAMEYMSRQYADKLNIIIARPFNYTGLGQSENFLVPKIVNHFRRRAKILELGNVDVSRDFSDVRIVTEYLHRLLESRTAVGEVFNICSGVPHSLRQIIDTCAKITGHSIDVRVNPAFVRPNEVKILTGSPAKLQAAVGKIDACPFEDTLRWMLEA